MQQSVKADGKYICVLRKVNDGTRKQGEKQSGGATMLAMTFREVARERTASGGETSQKGLCTGCRKKEHSYLECICTSIGASSSGWNMLLPKPSKVPTGGGVDKQGEAIGNATMKDRLLIFEIEREMRNANSFQIEEMRLALAPQLNVQQSRAGRRAKIELPVNDPASQARPTLAMRHETTHRFRKVLCDSLTVPEVNRY